MPTQHHVQSGDCISSIAFQYGLFPQALWNHPANAALKAQRKNPNTLAVGDVVSIPDKRLRAEPAATNATHQFRLKGVPAQCRLQIFEGSVARANQEYELRIDGVLMQGKTDAEGVLLIPISPAAQQGTLTIGPDRAVFDLDLGALPPADTMRGAQTRLRNLGLYEGEITDAPDDAVKEALKRIQRLFALPVTGDLDETTRQKINDLHNNVCEFPDEEDAVFEEDAEDTQASAAAETDE